MFQYRYGIKLAETTADTAVLKLLRKHFPEASLAELRAAVQNHDYIYLTDRERYLADGERRLAGLLQAFDQAGLETELFQEHRYTPDPWQTEPMSREFLRNSLRRSREICRETLIDIERELTGEEPSPETLADIEQAVLEEMGDAAAPSAVMADSPSRRQDQQ